jgi:hypothetical protein
MGTANSPEQLLAVERVEADASFDEAARGLIHLRQSGGGEHSRFLGFHQARGAKDLQLLRSICQVDAGRVRERLDVAFALRQQVQQFNPFRVREGFADAGELLKDFVFETPVRVCHAIHLIFK